MPLQEEFDDQIDGLQVSMFQHIEFDYFNHRGESSHRHGIVLGFFYGSTMYHAKPQWLALVRDAERQALRRFAVKDMTEVKIWRNSSVER